LSKQAEIPSSCGKGQGLHMDQKSGKKKFSLFFGNFFEVSVFTALTDNLFFDLFLLHLFAHTPFFEILPLKRCRKLL
jgi:hypothetical protein